jgi:hypothetical protein
MHAVDNDMFHDGEKSPAEFQRYVPTGSSWAQNPHQGVLSMLGEEVLLVMFASASVRYKLKMTKFCPKAEVPPFKVATRHSTNRREFFQFGRPT